MSYDNSSHSGDNHSVVSSSGSEEYLPKSNDFLDIESDYSTEEMNFIGQHSTSLQPPVMPVNMVQQAPGGMSQFSLEPPPLILSPGIHEPSEDILEFMSKQSKIIGSNMMEDTASPTVASIENGIYC